MAISLLYVQKFVGSWRKQSNVKKYVQNVSMQ